MIIMTPEDLATSKAKHMGFMTEETDDPLARYDPLLNPHAHTFTHCEIHPSMILGVCASIIPLQTDRYYEEIDYDPGME